MKMSLDKQRLRELVVHRLASQEKPDEILQWKKK